MANWKIEYGKMKESDRKWLLKKNTWITAQHVCGNSIVAFRI